MIRRFPYLLLLSLLVARGVFGAQNNRTFVAGKFALMVDGQHAGYLTSVDGSFAAASVVPEPESPDYYFKKHLGAPFMAPDFVIEFGVGMQPSFLQWVKDTLNRGVARHSASIIALDGNNKILRRLDLQSAQIVRVVFPRLDASSKTPYAMRAHIVPDNVFFSQPGGTYQFGNFGPKKQILTSNFRLTIPGLDTSKVSAVEELEVVIPSAPPPNTVCVVCPPLELRIDFPQLRIVSSEAALEDWLNWHQSFVMGGQNSDSDEKSGTLEILDATMKSTVMTFSFQGLGIVAVTNEPTAAVTPAVGATMYVEKMQWSFK